MQYGQIIYPEKKHTIVCLYVCLLQNKSQNDRESAVLDKLFEQKQQYVYRMQLKKT